MNNTATHKETDVSSADCNHDHSNPYCQCNTSDSERAEMLQRYLDAISSASPEPLLMPLGDAGKNPKIAGTCSLDSSQGRSFLVDGDEAVRCIRNEGVRGYFIYAGKATHGTEKLVFADRDEPEQWPMQVDTLRVLSGSGEGDHETYINADDVQNAEGKDDLSGAGGIRAHNLGVVTPGSIHPSGGIYHVTSVGELADLRPEDLPQALRPRLSEGSSERPTPVEHIEYGELPDKFSPNLQANDSEYILKVIRMMSPRLDLLLNSQNPKGYRSVSEADQATVRLLLYWRFDEPVIAKILRACRSREKLERGNYLRRTITRTTIEEPVDKALLGALVDSALNNKGRPKVGPESLQEARDALIAQGGKATTTDLTESGDIDWGDAKKESVRRRLNRSLDLLNDAGYVQKSKERGRNTWDADRLSSLTLPTDHLSPPPV